jgi:Mrp family chromosome partitioning ATPase
MPENGMPAMQIGTSIVFQVSLWGGVRLGLRTGILDANVYGHSIPHMLGITQRPVVVDKMIVPPVRGALKLMSIGFFLPALRGERNMNVLPPQECSAPQACRPQRSRSRPIR